MGLFKSSRLESFHKLQFHPWLKRSYEKLVPAEVQIIEDFIREHDQLSRADFELKVNRMFIDKPRPKHWKQIMELLTIAN